MLLTGDADGGSYDLYSIPKDANGSAVVRITPHLCLLDTPGNVLV